MLFKLDHADCVQIIILVVVERKVDIGYINLAVAEADFRRLIQKSSDAAGVILIGPDRRDLAAGRVYLVHRIAQKIGDIYVSCLGANLQAVCALHAVALSDNFGRCDLARGVERIAKQARVTEVADIHTTLGIEAQPVGADFPVLVLGQELGYKMIVGSTRLQLNGLARELLVLEAIDAAWHRVGFEIERCFGHVYAVAVA